MLYTIISINGKRLLNASVTCVLNDHIKANQAKIGPKMTFSLASCTEMLEFEDGLSDCSLWSIETWFIIMALTTLLICR